MRKWFNLLQHLCIALEKLGTEEAYMSQATDNLAAANARLAASVVRAADALKTANTRIADLTAQLAAAGSTDAQVQTEADAVNAQADALDALDAASVPPAPPA